jgi:hypothetical protein
MPIVKQHVCRCASDVAAVDEREASVFAFSVVFLPLFAAWLWWLGGRAIVAIGSLCAAFPWLAKEGRSLLAVFPFADLYPLDDFMPGAIGQCVAGMLTTYALCLMVGLALRCVVLILRRWGSA